MKDINNMDDGNRAEYTNHRMEKDPTPTLLENAEIEGKMNSDKMPGYEMNSPLKEKLREMRRNARDLDSLINLAKFNITLSKLEHLLPEGYEISIPDEISERSLDDYQIIRESPLQKDNNIRDDVLLNKEDTFTHESFPMHEETRIREKEMERRREEEARRYDGTAREEYYQQENEITNKGERIPDNHISMEKLKETPSISDEVFDKFIFKNSIYQLLIIEKMEKEMEKIKYKRMTEQRNNMEMKKDEKKYKNER